MVSAQSRNNNNVLCQDVCFRSKHITEELAQAFMDTESEGEFEGFSVDECDWRKPVVNMTKKTRTVMMSGEYLFS